MPIPAVLHGAAVSQALPLVAGLMRRGRPLSAPARWVLVWCGLLLLGDAVSLATALQRIENLWILYGFVPLESAVALWALSSWQPHALLRLSYRLAIPALLAATAVPLLLLPPQQTFDQIVAPLHALVLLVASLHTLLHRSILAEGSLARETWFWTGLGLCLYFGSDVAVRPFAQALLATNPDWVRGVYFARAWTHILAFVLITVGILCPLFPRRSGGRS